MALSARELVFYIRAENQASRVFQRVARDLRALPSQKELEARSATATRTAQAVAGGGAYLNNLKAANAEQTKSVSYRQREIEGQLKSNQLIAMYNKAQETVLANQASLNAAKGVQIRADMRLAALEAQGAHVAPRGTQAASAYQAQTFAADAARQRVQLLSTRQKVLADATDDVRLKTEAWNLAEQRALSDQNLQKYQRVSNVLHSIGSAARLAGAVTVAALAASAHSAANFQSQTILAATQARPAGAPASRTLEISRQLNDIVLAQMKQFPAASKDMADSLYQIFSGTKVQNIKQAGNLLTLFNKAAVAGGSDLKSMTDAFISIFNNFPGYFKNTTGAANIFFAAVRYGRMTATQFANALAYILPIAKEAGSTFENVASDMAFFTRQTGGRLTRQDAQGYSRLIQLLSRADVTAGLAGKGIRVFDEATGKMRPVVAILSEIHDKLKLSPQETLNFFKTISAAGSGKGGTQGTIQAIRIFAQGTQNIKAYQQVVREVQSDNNEFTRSFEAMSKAPGVVWATFVNQMKALALTIGEQAIPAIVQLAKPVVDALKWFNSLSMGTKHLIAQILVFGGIGLLVGGQLIMFASSIAGVVIALRLLSGTGGLLGAAGAARSAEGGFTAAGLAMRLGLIAGLIILIPLLLHFSGSLGGVNATMHLLAVAFIAFTTARMVSQLVAAQIGAVALRSTLMLLTAAPFIITIEIIGLEAAKRAIDSLQKKYLDAEGRFLKPKDLTREASAFLPLFHRLQEQGKSYSQILKTFQNMLGTSSQANDVIAKIFELSHGTKNVHTGPHDPGLGAPLQDAKQQVEQLSKNPAWNTLFKSAQDARKLVAQAPTTANWNAYFQARDQLQKASTKTQYEAAMKVLEQIKVSNRAVGKLTDAEVMRQVENINKLYRTASKHPSPAGWKAYYEAVAKLNANASQIQMEVANQYLKTDVANTKKAAKDKAKAISDQVAQAKQTWAQAAQSLQGQYQQMFQTNQSAMGTLFSGPVVSGVRVQGRLQWGGKLTGQDLLSDLKAQVSQFRQWRRALNQLRREGAPFELIQQIEAAGPAALPEIRALLGLSKADTRTYFRTFTQGRDAIAVATRQDFTIQLKHYRSFGRNIALQIIQGLRDERTPMLNYFKNLIRDMFPTLAQTAKNVPKDVTKGTVHPPTTKAQPPKVTRSSPHTKVSPKPARTTLSADDRPNVTYSINTRETDVSTGLRKATTHYKATYGGPH